MSYEKSIDFMFTLHILLCSINSFIKHLKMYHIVIRCFAYSIYKFCKFKKTFT